MTPHELRFLGELRASPDAPVIHGYALRFDRLSDDLGGFRERIAPDAKVEYGDVRALFNHDRNFVLGRISAKTLSLSRDTDGLRMEVTPPSTQWAQDLLVSIRRGDIDQQSFAFRVLPDGQEWSETKAGGLVRTLRAITIYDVSVVTTPAYPQTDASVRSITQILSDRPLVEKPDWGAIHRRDAAWLELQVRTAGYR